MSSNDQQSPSLIRAGIGACMDLSVVGAGEGTNYQSQTAFWKSHFFSLHHIKRPKIWNLGSTYPTAEPFNNLITKLE